MTDTELHMTGNSATSETTAPLSILAGPAGVKKLAESLQEKGLDCTYKQLEVEDDAGTTDLSYKSVAPLMAQAQEQGHQLIVAAQPGEHKVSVAVRKTADGPFQMLSNSQLAVLLVDALTEQKEKGEFACVRSVVSTDMLDSLLNRKGFPCKTRLLAGENLDEVVAATAAETGATTVLAITENGEFWCNRGFAFLLEQLLLLQETVSARPQTLFDQLLGLYYMYGYHREKTLAVSMAQSTQAAHYTHLMAHFRKAKTNKVGSFAIKEITDYQRKKWINMTTGKQLALDNEPVNLLKVVFTDGITLVMAPTEEKMYLYLSLSGKMMNKDHYNSMSRDFDQKLLKLVEVVNQL
jgi:phosphomannomutase